MASVTLSPCRNIIRSSKASRTPCRLSLAGASRRSISEASRKFFDRSCASVTAALVSAEEAVAMAERHRPDVVLMDIRLSGARDGICAAEAILSRFGIPSIFVTANTDPHTRQRALAVGGLGFIEKPVTKERLVTGLKAAVR
jgi:CheY-like chemotaxis protein